MSVFERMVERVKNLAAEDRKKIGGMHLGGMARQGLAELRQAVSLEGTVAQPTGMGVFGTITPGEVSTARQPEELARDPPAADASPDAAEADPVESARTRAAASATPGRESSHGAER